MACRAAGVIIVFAAPPSGRVSRSAAVSRGTPLTAVTSAPQLLRQNWRRLHIGEPPLGLVGTTPSWFVLASTFFGDRCVILFEHICILCHEVLARIVVHF